MALIEEEVREVFLELRTLAYVPQTPDAEIETLRRLLKELCDLRYVVEGTAVSLGLDIDFAYEEVHRSNMSKLERCPACRADGLHYDGLGVLYEDCPTCNGTGRVVLRRADGKILKGSEYTPPDMEQYVPGIIEGTLVE